jgi:acyl-[acyl carrier protein]--UDP-N-acetylglucosamine O-acyltransferase
LRDPWARIFARAVADRPENSSDIVPYWQVDGEYGIERHIPMLPLSRDQQRYEDLMSALALYRLVFGQPRQDELLHLVAERWDTSNVERLLAERINLQPRN